jgi:hypothetical protein
VSLRIRPALETDMELLFGLIRELAEYEKLADKVVGDPEVLRRTLFEQRAAEALIVEANGEAIGYAIFFVTFSSFECRSGVWIEDIYVRPDQRRGHAPPQSRGVMRKVETTSAWCASGWAT